MIMKKMGKKLATICLIVISIINSFSIAYASEIATPSTNIASTGIPATPTIDAESDAVFTLTFDRDENGNFHMTKYISMQRILNFQPLQ